MAEKPAGSGTPNPDPAKAAAEKATADAAAKATADAATKAAADAAAAAQQAGKGDEAKPGGKADEGKPESKAPEKYDLKVPEAGTAFVLDADLKRLEALAREANWSNEDTQAALEEHVALNQQLSQDYLAETKADKTYGGEKLAETQKLANRVIDRIRPDGHARRDSFLRFLKRGGSDNHIEVVSFLADLGKMMGEDSPGHTRPAGGGKEDVADTLYDHPTSRALDKATK